MPRKHSAKSERLKEAFRLRRLRQHLNLSQREIAREFCVGNGAVSLWESGSRTIPGPVLRLMEIYETETGLNRGKPGEGLRAEFRTSWISRNIQLSAALALIAAKFTRASLGSFSFGGPKPDKLIGNQLGRTLGNLKGLLMKLGQIFCDFEMGIPDGFKRSLDEALKSANPIDRKEVDWIFENELGRKTDEIFVEWGEPVAVASIGQVHSARTTNSEKFAVKVQYPGIHRSISSDLSNAKAIEFLGGMFFRQQDRDGLFSELKEHFVEECDYLQEGRNQEQIRSFFDGHPQILVPKVHWPLTTKNILTTEFMAGETFSEFLSQSTQAERNQAGETIFQFAFESVFLHGVFNADPGTGNFLFQKKNAGQSQRVVFLDFGCVKRLRPAFLQTWKEYILGVMNGKRKLCDRILVDMGYVPNPRRFDFDYHHSMMEYFYQPWMSDEPFQFGPHFVERNWKSMMTSNPNRSGLNLPRDWTFVNRLQWGLFSLLASLRAESSWRQKILPLLDSRPGKA